MLLRRPALRREPAARNTHPDGLLSGGHECRRERSASEAAMAPPRVGEPTVSQGGPLRRQKALRLSTSGQIARSGSPEEHPERKQRGGLPRKRR
jgi:hypothetical protein